jgi:hypothetical protein
LVCVKNEALPRKVITIFGLTPLSIGCLRVTSTLFGSATGLASVKLKASFISFDALAVSGRVVVQRERANAAIVATRGWIAHDASCYSITFVARRSSE